MYYPDEIIKEVCARNDLLKIVLEDVDLVQKKGLYYGLCPFHSEASPSFSVNGKNQTFYCYGCGTGGNVISYVMQSKHLTFEKSVEYLATKAGIFLPLINKEMNTSDKQTVLAMNREAAKFYYYKLHEKNNEGMSYFRTRGLTDATIQKFGLGFAGGFGKEVYNTLGKGGFSDKDILKSGLVKFGEINSKNSRGKEFYDLFWNRVMFPIQDENGRVIGFGGRVLGSGKPKYLNSPETIAFNKHNNLYAMHIAKHTEQSFFILAEGYMDVISLHAAGFDNAVASLGTALTREQVSLLKKHTNEVYISYDGDEAGTAAILRAIPLLESAGISTRVVNMGVYKDPDEFIKNLGSRAYAERLKNAVPSECFVIQNLRKTLEKSAFYKEATNILLKK